MTLSSPHRHEVRRFLRLLILIVITTLAIGFVGGHAVLGRVEKQLLLSQARAAQREAVVISGLVRRDLAAGTTPVETVSRLQKVLNGTGGDTDFLCLLDANGRVLSHPNPKMIGEQWGDMSVQRLETGIPVPISELLASRRPSAGLHREPNEPLQIVHFEPVTQEAWTIAVHQNAAVTAAEFARLRWNLGHRRRALLHGAGRKSRGETQWLRSHQCGDSS